MQGTCPVGRHPLGSGIRPGRLDGGLRAAGTGIRLRRHARPFGLDARQNVPCQLESVPKLMADVVRQEAVDAGSGFRIEDCLPALLRGGKAVNRCQRDGPGTSTTGIQPG